MSKATKYFSARPLVFRAHPIRVGVCIIIPWFGWIYLAYWLARNSGRRVEVTATNVSETKWFGVAENLVDVPLSSIRATGIKYGLCGKFFNAGSVVLTLNDDKTIVLSTVEAPEALVHLIDKLRA